MFRLTFTLCLALLTVHASAQDTIPLTSNQWVQLPESGVFQGRVFVPDRNGSAVAVANAAMVMRSIDEGNYFAETVTNSTGEFTFQGVQQGVYSLTSSATNASSHQAVQIIASDADLGGQYPRDVEISATPLTYSRFRSIVRRYEPPMNNRRISIATADFAALAGNTINDDTYRVVRIDGGMDGRISRAGGYGDQLMPAPITNVLIYRRGVQVGRAVTDPDGYFRVPNLNVGTYSLLAVGRDGIASIGFELVSGAAGQLSQQTTDRKILVSKLAAPSAFGCQVAPLGEEVDDALGEDGDGGEGGFPPAPFYGFGGGGPGSGGGGGGGGGGVGGLAGLAGLAAAAGAIGSGSGGGGLGVVPPPEASPAMPPDGGGEPEVEF